MRNPVKVLEEAAALIDARADNYERRYNYVYRDGLRAAAAIVRDHAAALKTEMETEEAQAWAAVVAAGAARATEPKPEASA